jgi:cell pole-organizing protein PopZ
MSDTPRNDAAMAEILASMRRIVAENEPGVRRLTQASDALGVLVLTRAMRTDLPPPNDDEQTDDAPPAVAAPGTLTRSSPDASPDRTVGVRRDMARSERADADETAAMLEGAPDSALDEAAVADIVRAVLRDEFSGTFGRNLTQQIRSLVHAEVTRALAARDQK